MSGLNAYVAQQRSMGANIGGVMYVQNASFTNLLVGPPRFDVRCCYPPSEVLEEASVDIGRCLTAVTDDRQVSGVDGVMRVPNVRQRTTSGEATLTDWGPHHTWLQAGFASVLLSQSAPLFEQVGTPEARVLQQRAAVHTPRDTAVHGDFIASWARIVTGSLLGMTCKPGTARPPSNLIL
eukprot:NODE_5179_length_719_cov_20.520270_g5156_i0.p1 GENE.NODE_5179_length_719_cov_20.520270_g5156_i0~~NODE_5179_length_719_cov_20.520270_g5156_i0.p1  ORF type:complete len:211 (+),score=52.38 NODE_5179_length_719_cov_20.520270_g5156_i0:96-635(+)